MGFSVFVETLNLRTKKTDQPVQLREPQVAGINAPADEAT